MNAHRRRPWWRRHSLTLVAGAILLLWIVLYACSSPQTHAGSFFGNAIADWSGLVVMVLATKHLYEKGSSESKEPSGILPNRVEEILREHSLSIFLVLTGALWVALFVRMDAQGKWGQVVGNIVSEWTQILGLVLLTKRLIEIGSKESKR
jgi:peptidoglycan/LPS O-acetylase OafA/YrhL